MPPRNQPLSLAGDGGWPHHALLTRLGHPCSPAPTTGAGFPCSPQSAGGWGGTATAELVSESMPHYIGGKGSAQPCTGSFYHMNPQAKSANLERRRENAK